MRVLIDSSAWIEYIDGSNIGKKVRDLILSENEIYSLSVIISEVISKTKRQNKNTDLSYNILNRNSIILEISPEIAKQAGLIHAEQKLKQKSFSLVDSIILSTARKLNAKVLTKDSHLLQFKESLAL